MTNNIPSINTPLTDANGQMSATWHEFFRRFIVATTQTVASVNSGVNNIVAGAGLSSVIGSTSTVFNAALGAGLNINANNIVVDIAGQSNKQAVNTDEVMLSNSRGISKTTVSSIAALATFSGTIDNLNFAGNTISALNTNGNITLTPKGTGVIQTSGGVTLGTTDSIYWTGGSPTTYCINGNGGIPTIQGADNTYTFTSTPVSWILKVGTGNSITWSASTGNMTVAGLGLKMTNTPIYRFAVTGITASTTQTQGQGALTGDINEISVCANLNDTVTIPVATAAGRQCVVINHGAQTLRVWPASGGNLGAGLNTSTTIVAGSRKLFIAYSATNWEPVI